MANKKKTGGVSEIIPIIQKETGKKESKGQKLFNSRIKKINKLKVDIEDAEKQIDIAKQRLASEIEPLVQKNNLARYDLVKILDKSYDLKFFRKREKEKISDVLLNIAEPLCDILNEEELHNIFNRHVKLANEALGFDDEDDEWDEDEENELMEEMGKGMLEDMLKQMMGIDVDLKDVDMNNLEGSLDDIKAQIDQQKFEQAEEEAKKKSKKKKSKAQIKKEEEEKKVSQTSKSIYKQLVKLLHPDFEQDEQEKVWKTDAIKEVTEAYNKGDFFGLLRLQIKYIDKTEGELSKLSNDQIKYYNKILLTQLRELQEQYDMMTGWGPIGSFYRQFCGSPDIMDMKIDREKRNLEKDLEHVTNDTEEFKNKKTLRGFLRQYVIRPPMSSFFDDFFGGF